MPGEQEAAGEEREGGEVREAQDEDEDEAGTGGHAVAGGVYWRGDGGREERTRSSFSRSESKESLEETMAER